LLNTYIHLAVTRAYSGGKIEKNELVWACCMCRRN